MSWTDPDDYWIRRIENLEQAIAKSEKDAERYRKLRDGHGWPAVFASSDAPEPLRGEELDAAIDAAMQP